MFYNQSVTIKIPSLYVSNNKDTDKSLIVTTNGACYFLFDISLFINAFIVIYFSQFIRSIISV